MIIYLDVYEVWTTVYLDSRVYSIAPAREIAINGLPGLLACLILPCGFISLVLLRYFSTELK